MENQTMFLYKITAANLLPKKKFFRPPLRFFYKFELGLGIDG